MLRSVVALIFAALASQAVAQSTILQGDQGAPGHVPQYIFTGGSQSVIVDGGSAGGGAAGANLSELGIAARGTGNPPYVAQGAGPNGENICDYDGPTTSAAGYHVLCFSANAAGGGLISYNAFGGAATLPLLFQINGALSAIVLGPGASTNGDFACWNGTGGNLLSDCGSIIPIGNGGTGQTTASAAINALLPAQGGNSGKVLSTNGTAASWQAAGAGTVSSITAGTGLSGGTITTTGTISLTNNATTVNGQSCALGSTCTVPISLVVGTTTITSGTNGRIEYNNAGVVGELATNGTGNVSLTTSPTFVTPILGAASASSVAFTGSGSGTATVTPQATAGTPTLTLPNASGTFAVSASSPLTLSATTGAMACATCVTSSGGGAITGTAPVSVSAAGAVSVTGAAGQVLAGASPAFTATPTLGVAGSSVGSLALANATSGTITIQPTTGALGSSVLTLPAATDTLIGKATTDTLTNKTLTSPALGGTVTGNNTVPLGILAQIGANTELGNWTAGSTNVTANAMPSCSDSGGNHLNYVSGTGITCGTSDSHAGTVTSIATTGPITGGTITATGTIACATCVTSSGGGAATGTAPVAVSAAGVVSITGVAGQVLAGSTPAFTNAPTLGVAGSSVGSIAFANATSGTVTIQPVTGALGSVTLSLPAATDTLVGKATTDTLTNKSISGATNTLTAIPLSAFTNLGTTTTVLHGNAAGSPTFSAVSMSADVTGQLPLANGGTNANLTASNGGLFYSTGSAGAILAGTATANQIPLSGASTTPAWSTSTYPATSAAGTMLASLTANTITATISPQLGAANTGGTLTLGPTSGGGAAGVGSIILQNFGANASGQNSITATNARGVAGTPTAVQANDPLFQFGVSGSDGTNAAGTLGFDGAVSFTAWATFTTSIHPTYASIFTTPKTTKTAIEALRVDGAAHVGNPGASVPVITSCGTTPSAATGSDMAGQVTEGTTATGCTITFAVTYAAAPFCVVGLQTQVAAFSYTLSTSAITVTNTSTSNDKINWVCHGN